MQVGNSGGVHPAWIETLCRPVKAVLQGLPAREICGKSPSLGLLFPEVSPALEMVTASRLPELQECLNTALRDVWDVCAGPGAGL